jgi:hypothetical protein
MGQVTARFSAGSSGAGALREALVSQASVEFCNLSFSRAMGKSLVTFG